MKSCCRLCVLCGHKFISVCALKWFWCLNLNSSLLSESRTNHSCFLPISTSSSEGCVRFPMCLLSSRVLTLTRILLARLCFCCQSTSESLFLIFVFLYQIVVLKLICYPPHWTPGFEVTLCLSGTPVKEDAGLCRWPSSQLVFEVSQHLSWC